MNLPSGIKFDFVEFLKLAPKYFLPLLILSGVIIFSPIEWLEYLSLKSAIDEYRWIFSLIFILSVSMFVSGILIKVTEYFQQKREKRIVMKNLRERINSLSSYQKKILITLLESGNRTITLSIDDGEVKELERFHYIYRATSISREYTDFDYCLHPIAEKILKKNRRYLNEKK